MWDDIELNTDHIPALKLAFHIGQFVCTLVLWCMEIAVFRAEGSVVNGNVGWTFAVCFLSIPAWIYLVMAPRFPRTRKFAQPYVMATLDGVFALIWISAFATQAAYNSANKCGTACAVSKACVAMGVFVFIFSCVTTFLSIWTVKYWQFNNSLPGYDRGQIPAHNIDPDKAAFSTAPHDDDAYERVNMDDHDEDGRRPGRFNPDPYGAPSSLVSDPYGAGPASTVGGSQVGSYVSTSYSGAPENPFRQDNPFDSDSEYHRPSPSPGPSVAGGRYAHPTAHDDLEDDRRPVAAFPSADYDRITR